LAVAALSGSGCSDRGDAGSQTIRIDPQDDSCVPVSARFASCAEACGTDPLGCAQALLAHIQGPGFLARRELNPSSIDGVPPIVQKPNLQTPMHGLFVPIWNNPQLNDAIEAAIASPFAPVAMPPWSISAKLNNNPGTPSNPDGEPVNWATVMYKIPGYCPERIFPTADAPCKGGEWFWFLYRDGFPAFQYDPTDGASVPAWGKAETFCLDCHAAVADTDWLWLTHDLVRRAQQDERPVTTDGQTPGDSGSFQCDDPVLGPVRPQDVLRDPGSLTPAQAQRMFDCWSWQTFVALNWPADDERRGVPDEKKPISDPGDRVWETYKQVYETFQPGDAEWSLDGRGWNDRQPLPEVCQEALRAAGISPEESRTFQVLNETHQAFGNQFNDLIDRNGNVTHYEVRLNEAEFEFIKGGGFARTGAYDWNGPLGTTKSLLAFPDNRSSVTGQGATEVKAAFKVLCTQPGICDPIDDPSRYLSRKALLYAPATQRTVDPYQRSDLPRPAVTTPATCRLADMGLVGFHLAVKTFWSPQWIWPTFEHIDNVPGNAPDGGADGYSYFDPNCPEPSASQCLTQRPGVLDANLACCPNQQIIANSQPDPTRMARADPSLLDDPIANQMTRLDPIQSTAETLNRLFRPLLADAGSPLQYYVLVSTQWPGGGRVVPGDEPSQVVNRLCLEGGEEPCFTFLPPNLRLRNTTIESYQASFCLPTDEDIGNDPASCTPGSVTEDPKLVSSGGCMNCHFSSGTDSSFVWADAVEEIVPLGGG